MDQTSVRNAVSLSGFTAGDLAIQWSNTGSTVTLTPRGSLAYAATSSSPDGLVAKTYTITVNSAAKDLAGNALGATFSSSFATLRRVTAVLSPLYVEAYSTEDWQSARGPQQCSGTLPIGGWNGTYSGGDNYGFVAFDASSISAPNQVYLVEAVTFNAIQREDVGDFYGAFAVGLKKVRDDSMLFALSSFTDSVTHDLGALSTSDTSAFPTVSALVAFQSDFVTGITKQVYRLDPEPIPPAWSGTQRAIFTCDGFHLDVTYLIP